ncbi:hypothetical protein BY996DRAFT_7357516 [Phakopsora pachyrhizi]|uniref:Expressed protein n=1 Tax=Phakopsora pachyrhizi TaxID=170000 RepID=A0AAV0AJY1_PHAPC|nr:hypothetical protein BY996DRAFT_7357516 [Phakopsora pachyrhizi]CAH7667740.1 expressed protein [Phakopsora pachyrhizi]
MFKVTQVGTDKNLFEECKKIRRQVFVDEQKFRLEDEFDDLDDESLHILFSPDNDEGGYVGTLRFVTSLQKVGRIAILRDHRNRSYGSKMFLELERILTEELKSLFYPKGEGPDREGSTATGRENSDGLVVPTVRTLDGRSLVEIYRDKYKHLVDGGQSSRKSFRINLHSQMYIIPFYEKLGYRSVGETFDEDGAPHQLMFREIEI